MATKHVIRLRIKKPSGSIINQEVEFTPNAIGDILSMTLVEYKTVENPLFTAQRYSPHLKEVPNGNSNSGEET